MQCLWVVKSSMGPWNNMNRHPCALYAVMPVHSWAWICFLIVWLFNIVSKEGFCSLVHSPHSKSVWFFVWFSMLSVWFFYVSDCIFAVITALGDKEKSLNLAILAIFSGLHRYCGSRIWTDDLRVMRILEWVLPSITKCYIVRNLAVLYDEAWRQRNMFFSPVGVLVGIQPYHL